MNLDSTLLTVDWLNRQLDKIIIITEYMDEIVQETEDESVLLFLQQRLQILERECTDVGNKIEFEKKQLLSYIGGVLK